jgi:two-component system nitrogen regulation response regulator GlnG
MKLLRVIQERQVVRLGGAKAQDINVRLLVATNSDLYADVQSNLFRSDLYYRLNEFILRIPPLRERQEDIPFLAERFREQANCDLGKNVFAFDQAALDLLMRYSWPGNVRQLRSTIRQAVLLAKEQILEKHIRLDGQPSNHLMQAEPGEPCWWSGKSLREIVQENTRDLERKVISSVLLYTKGNKAEAARLLQVDYKTLHTKIKVLGIYD